MTDYRLGRDRSELLASINSAYTLYSGELALAGPHWERKPASGEGEDGWCARQVAEHLAGASGFFAASIAKQINVDPPAMQRYTFEDAEAAVAGMPAAQASLMSVVDQITDEALEITFELQPLGEITVGNLVGIVSHHLNDHATQLRTLRES